MLHEASVLDSKNVDDNLCRSPTAAEAAVNHDVFVFRDGQGTFVPPADRAHQRQPTRESYRPLDMRTSSAAVMLKAAAHPLRDDRLELGRSLLPDAVARLKNIQARIG